MSSESGDDLKQTIRPDWWFMATDETSDWNLEPELRAWVKQILTVTLFDRRRHVHCCELTPSYELWPVEYLVICHPETPEPTRDRIEQLAREAHGETSVGYKHVASVETAMRRCGVDGDLPTPKGLWWYPDKAGQVTPCQFAHYGELRAGAEDPSDEAEREQWIDTQRKALIEWYGGTSVF